MPQELWGIVLIGSEGVGKTEHGKRLHLRQGYAFVDFDDICQRYPLFGSEVIKYVDLKRLILQGKEERAKAKPDEKIIRYSAEAERIQLEVDRESFEYLTVRRSEKLLVIATTMRPPWRHIYPPDGAKGDVTNSKELTLSKALADHWIVLEFERDPWPVAEHWAWNEAQREKRQRVDHFCTPHPIHSSLNAQLKELRRMYSDLIYSNPLQRYSRIVLSGQLGATLPKGDVIKVLEALHEQLVEPYSRISMSKAAGSF